MLVNIKSILALLLLKLCIVTTSQQNLPEVRTKMIQLLKLCFDGDLKTVITTPDLGELFREASWEYGPIPMILIDHNFKSNHVHQLSLHYPTFVFEAQSLKSFESMLLQMKSSPWWSIKSLFFIIGNSREGCESTAAIFKHTWSLNLLSTLFLCYDKDKGAMLYTYNLFTHPPPSDPWKKMEKHSDITDDRWHLYVQPLFQDRRNCASLNYIKTKWSDKYKTDHRQVEL